MSLLPAYITPEELAEHLQVSERTIRQIARKLSACSEIGKKMILTEDDIQQIMESTRPCHLKSKGEAKSGTTQGQFPVGDYEDLRARLKKPKHKGSRQKSRPERGIVVSMDQELV